MSRIAVFSLVALAVSACGSVDNKRAVGDFKYAETKEAEYLVIPEGLEAPKSHRDFKVSNDINYNGPVGANVDIRAPSLVLPIAASSRVINQSEESIIWFDQVLEDNDLQGFIVEALKAQLTSQLLSAGIVLLLSILIMVYVMNLMFAPLLRITHALGAIANGNGDLTQRLKIESHDEIGEVANSFNVFKDRQHALNRHINQQSVDLEKDASHGVENSQLTMKSLESQQENLISVATAMNQMSGAASDIAMNAAQTATAAQQSTKNSEDGLTLASSTRHSVQQLALEVSNTTDVISELNSHVNSISGILVTIQAIAEQTNLLALNAAIEAARAGEQGRGFAVVADEVRVLSKRTQDSTQEIYSMIETLQKSTSKVVEAMESNKQTVEGTVSDIDHLADSLNESNQAIALISDMATQIATAAEEQSQVILEMNDNTMTIKETSEDIMLSAQSSLGQAQELKMHADSLNEQVSQFKI